MTVRFVFALGFVSLSTFGFSQINSAGPFGGHIIEDFESFPNYRDGGVYSSVAIMGHTAFLDSANGSKTYIYEPGVTLWGLGAYGPAHVTSGAKGAGLFNDLRDVDVTLHFFSGVRTFGGYFACDSNGTGLTNVQFFDGAGVQIGATQTFGHGSNEMRWYGWNSADPFSTIRFSGNFAPVMDDVRFDHDLVPEPATWIALSLGAAALRRRRSRLKSPA